MLFIIISFWYNFQCGLSVLPPASFVPELIWRKNLCLGVAETPTSHGEQESLVAAFRLSAVNLTYKTRDSVSQNNEVGLYIEARSCIIYNITWFGAFLVILPNFTIIYHSFKFAPQKIFFRDLQCFTEVFHDIEPYHGCYYLPPAPPTGGKCQWRG